MFDLKRVTAAALLCGGAVALVVAEPQSANQAMARAAKALIATLEPAQLEKLRFPFASEERFNWHFIPRTRLGLPLKEMTEAQRTAAFALLKTGLSEKGYTKAETIRSFEDILRAVEKGRITRDPELYFFSIFGDPDEATWGWRYEGHHIAQNWTIAGGKAISTSPAFLGANPAEVREGPRTGTRPLGAEEDLARAFVAALTPDQLKTAIVNPTAPNDIVTMNSRKASRVEHGGIAAATLTDKQRGLLMALIEEHAMVQSPALAQGRLAKVKAESPGQHPVRLARHDREGEGALLQHSGRDVPHRVRQHAEQRQSPAHCLARLQRRLRHRSSNGPVAATLRFGSSAAIERFRVPVQGSAFRVHEVLFNGSVSRRRTRTLNRTS